MKIDFATYQGRLAGTVDVAREVERLGFDGYFVSEAAFDPFLPLSLVAEHTNAIDVGTAVAVAFPRSPVHLAHLSYELERYSQGRFILGLGSQTKAHIERRFSSMWSKPIERMEELVASVRAVWNAWHNEEELNFRGDFYNITLMPPFFTPPRHDGTLPRIFLAAVGERMVEAVGAVADGIFVHPFHTSLYLDSVTMPAIRRGLARSARDRSDIEISCALFVVSGETDEERRSAKRFVRRQLSFYGSTPAYRRVLEVHGWGELHRELHALSKRGLWEQMASLIDDEVLSTFAVCAPPDELGQRIADRMNGRADRISFYTQDDRPYPKNELMIRQLKNCLK